MARVNVEESAIAAARRMSRQLRIKAENILGKLVILWRESQTLEVDEAHKEDLLDWLGLIGHPKADLFLAALVENKVLEVAGTDRWKILGNDKHIENLRERRAAGQAGGIKSGKTRKTKQVLQPNASTECLNPVQSSTVQSSTEHMCIAPVAPTHTQPSGIPTEIKTEWEATLKHYGKPVNWARDMPALYRVYQQVAGRDWLRVRHALAGFRCEKKSERYDPSDECHLARLEDRKKFLRLESLGEGKQAQADGDEELAKVDAELAEAKRRLKAEPIYG